MRAFPNFKNKKVLIFGLGLLGRGLKDAIFFAEQGAEVTITDLKNEIQLASSLEKLKKYSIHYTLGQHQEEDFLNADLIIRNAGVPASSPYLKLAKRHKIAVEMDESLFVQYCPCPIIGITGTRGKSTTTTLIGELLKQNWGNRQRQVYVSGNLLGEATLPLLPKLRVKDLVVLELSSWQLQGLGEKKFSPHIAVFTNFSPDHLNYYKTLKDYLADKKNIFQFQKTKDFCVLNGQDKTLKKLAKEIPSQISWFSADDIHAHWQPRLSGQHNLENLAAAKRVGEILNIQEEKIKKTLCAFTGLEHRLEKVREINRIIFINDTTSTTPTSVQRALDAIKKNLILLAGGASKNIALKPLAESIANHSQVKGVILLEGSATDELTRELEVVGASALIIGRFNNLAEAVKRAYELSLPGDTILLSPGCASFGMFINEFDRGEQFKKIVNQL